MRVRHKQPTLVSMWMLDVFCCALGCVTLLWLMNTRQANDQTAAAKTALADLTSARSELVASAAARSRLAADVEQLKADLLAARADRDQTARTLAVAQSEASAARTQLDARTAELSAAKAKLDSTAVELTAAANKAADADDVLRKKQRDADALSTKLAAAATSAEELATVLRKKDDELAAAGKRAAELQAQLDAADAKLKTATAADKERTTAAGQVKDLEAKLTEARTTIIDLQGEKAKLADKVSAARQETDAKFAGIAMTGRRVVFLVDRSGSMDRVDENTIAPTKWPTVAETVAKVMRTVPDLEQFQVVVFSRESKWLTGSDDWIPYRGESSAVAVKDALLAVKPEGDTNLYAAFELAFGLREKGLDTIYLFSDGLPTSGPGLTDAQLRQNPPLREGERSELLSRHLRERLNRLWNRPTAGRPKVKVNAVGFFYESPEVGAFLWSLARENDGSFVGMSRP